MPRTKEEVQKELSQVSRRVWELEQELGGLIAPAWLAIITFRNNAVFAVYKFVPQDKKVNVKPGKVGQVIWYEATEHVGVFADEERIGDIAMGEMKAFPEFPNSIFAVGKTKKNVRDLVVLAKEFTEPFGDFISGLEYEEAQKSD